MAEIGSRAAGTNKTVISYKLSSMDIFLQCLRIYRFLLIIPSAFLTVHLLLYFFDTPGALEEAFSFLLFSLSILIIASLIIKRYFLFKKQYFFSKDISAYFAEFLDSGVALYQEGGEHFTEYVWQDFIDCRETKKAIYLYFKYDRLLIVKKYFFITGSDSGLRELISEKIPGAKLLRR